MPDQAAFRAALLNADAPVPQGLTDGSGQPTKKRYNVYRNNVAVSLTEALRTAFPAIRALVGDAFFDAMAGVFLRQHPPSSPLMMFYGAEMPEFLAGFPPAVPLPYLPDIARLELAMRHAYHAGDTSPITAEALAAIPPEALEGMRLSFAPAVQCLSSAYALYGIYRAATDSAAQKPGKDAEAVLIARPEMDPTVDPMTPANAACLSALLDGATLADAAGAAPDADLGALLGLLLQRNAITALHH